MLLIVFDKSRQQIDTDPNACLAKQEKSGMRTNNDIRLNVLAILYTKVTTFTS